MYLTRPFKFQSFWLSDPSLPNVVNQAWQHPRKLIEAIGVFSRQASLWNKNHFRNIFHKKKRVLARLDGVQRALASQPSIFLVALENQLIRELDVVLEQERDLWALKSRINWMILGDRNTSFYHVSALAHRKRNLITAIKNDAGEWLSEEIEVANHIREEFINIYTTSQEAATYDFNYNLQWQTKLSSEEKNSISRLVTEEEIRAALWSLKAFKAPGLDGLHAGFFQRFWLVVGRSISEEVIAVFREKKIPEYMNSTNIVLIPKTQGPESIGSYRPISLCNTVYKIVSKILVGRIRPLLDQLISPCQTAFVPGRRGVDNVIVV